MLEYVSYLERLRADLCYINGIDIKQKAAPYCGSSLEAKT
jgi:hypothetical protein